MFAGESVKGKRTLLAEGLDYDVEYAASAPTQQPPPKASAPPPPVQYAGKYRVTFWINARLTASH